MDIFSMGLRPKIEHDFVVEENNQILRVVETSKETAKNEFTMKNQVENQGIE